MAVRVVAVSGMISLRATILPGLVVPRLVDHAHRAAANLTQSRVMRHRLGQRRRLGAAQRAPPFDHLGGIALQRTGDRDILRRRRPQPAHLNGCQTFILGANSKMSPLHCSKAVPDQP